MLEVEKEQKKLVPLRRFAQDGQYTTAYLSILVQRKKLKAKKIGRNFFTSKEWFDEYLEKHAREEKRTVSSQEENKIIEIKKQPDGQYKEKNFLSKGPVEKVKKITTRPDRIAGQLNEKEKSFGDVFSFSEDRISFNNSHGNLYNKKFTTLLAVVLLAAVIFSSLAPRASAAFIDMVDRAIDPIVNYQRLAYSKGSDLYRVNAKAFYYGKGIVEKINYKEISDIRISAIKNSEGIATKINKNIRSATNDFNDFNFSLSKKLGLLYNKYFGKGRVAGVKEVAVADSENYVEGSGIYFQNNISTIFGRITGGLKKIGDKQTELSLFFGKKFENFVVSFASTVGKVDKNAGEKIMQASEGIAKTNNSINNYNKSYLATESERSVQSLKSVYLSVVDSLLPEEIKNKYSSPEPAKVIVEKKFVPYVATSTETIIVQKEAPVDVKKIKEIVDSIIAGKDILSTSTIVEKTVVERTEYSTTTSPTIINNYTNNYYSGGGGGGMSDHASSFTVNDLLTAGSLIVRSNGEIGGSLRVNGNISANYLNLANLGVDNLLSARGLSAGKYGLSSDGDTHFNGDSNYISGAVNLTNLLNIDYGSLTAMTIGDGTTDTLVVDTSGDSVIVNGNICFSGDCKASWSEVVTSSGYWTAATGGIHYSAGNIALGTSTAPSLFTIGATSTEQFLVNSSGIITDGTWNGDVITSAYLPANTVYQGNNVSLLVNDSGYITASSTDTLTNKTWNGDVIGLGYGGTGTSTIFSAGSVLFSDGSSLAEDNSNLYWDSVNKRLGIGTSTPSQKLDVNGSISAANNIYVSGSYVYGDSISQYLRLSSSAGTVLAYSNTYVAMGNGFTKFVESGSEVARITATGLAIGTTTPSALLTVGATSTQQFLVNSLGVVTDGTWNGDVIGLGYGGTGTSTAFSAGSVLFSDGSSLAQDNSSLYWDNTNKRLGVGTTTPTSMLHLYSDNPILTFTSSNAFSGATINVKGLNQDTDQLFKVQDEGTNRLTILRSGSVGIGTTSPSQKLDVNGSISAASNIYVNGSYIYGDSSTPYLRLKQGTGSFLAYGTTYLGIGSGTQTFNISGTAKMFLNTDGLAIGAATPSALLTVGATSTQQFLVNSLGVVTDGTWNGDVIGLGYGGTGTSTAFSAGSVLFSDGSSLAQDNSNLYWDNTNKRLGLGGNPGGFPLNIISNAAVVSIDSSGATTGGSGIWMDADRASAGAISGYWYVYNNGGTPVTGIRNLRGTTDLKGVMAFDTSNSERMRIDEDGNIGIGTSSPSSKLHVSGGFMTLDNNYGLATLRSDTVPAYLIKSTTADNTDIRTMKAGASVLFSDNNSNLLGSIADLGTTGRLYVSGDVGIGTTSPAQKLEVAGNIIIPNNSAYMTYTSTGLQATLLRLSSGNIWQAYGGGFQFNDFNSNSFMAITDQGTTGDVSFNNGQMFIKNDGNVGIGTTTPSQKLDVAGNISASGALYLKSDAGTGTSGLLFGSTSDVNLYRQNSNNLRTDDNFVVGSNLYVVTAIYGSSASGANLTLKSTSDNTGGTVIVQGKLTQVNDIFQIKRNSGTVIMSVTDSEYVGIGTSTPLHGLHIGSASSSKDVMVANGGLCVDDNDSCAAGFTPGAIIAKSSNLSGADYAEYFYTVDTDLESGEVVCVDVTNDNAVKRCDRGADDNVMGIVSSDPSIVGNAKDHVYKDAHYKIIGMLGQVPARVSAENGPIRPGDSLTSASSTPGYVMRADPGEATVGVALEGLSSGQGTIQVLISRRNKSMTVETIEQQITDRIAAMEIQDEVNLLVSNAVNNLNIDRQIADVVNGEIVLLDAKLTVEIDNLTGQINNVKNDFNIILDRVATLENNVSLVTDQLAKFFIGDNGEIKFGNNISTSSPVAIVEVNASSTLSAFVIKQDGSGDLAQFYNKDVEIFNIGQSGRVAIVGEMMVDGRIMVCSGGSCGDKLDNAVDETMGDMGVEGKVVAGAFEGYCDDGWVWVPGSAKYGTMPGFCVMENEASESSFGAPESVIGASPWVGLNQGEAEIACQSLGSDYHLISENEWMTIANNIIRVADNDIDPIKDGLQLATSSSSQVLSNYSTISNMSGGVAEWTDQTVTLAGLVQPVKNVWQEYYDITDYKGFNITPPYYYNSTNGIGMIFTGDNSENLRGFVRGFAGLYDLDLSNTPITTSSNIGFRCAK